MAGLGLGDCCPFDVTLDRVLDLAVFAERVEPVLRFSIAWSTTSRCWAWGGDADNLGVVLSERMTEEPRRDSGGRVGFSVISIMHLPNVVRSRLYCDCLGDEPCSPGDVLFDYSAARSNAPARYTVFGPLGGC